MGKCVVLGEKIMNNQPVVSICIPTKKRVDIVRETLKSLLSQDADKTLYEICISDNSETDETKNLIEKEFSDVPNLYYRKSDCQGFLNSIEALKLGNGKLLKLHNDYSKFKPGALREIINVSQKYGDKSGVIFFAMGTIDGPKNISEHEDFDSFLNFISYMSTWSSAFSIWKKDMEKLIEDNIQVDSMFPHTTLLFSLTGKEQYIVDNHEYVESIPLKKKGGYNLIDNFVRIYLTMVHSLLIDKSITQQTYDKFENGIIKFCAYWYALVKTNPNLTFSFENKEKLISKQCGNWAVYRFSIYFYLYYYPKAILRKLIKVNN